MHPDVYRGPWGGAHCRDSPVQTLRSCDCSPQGPCKASCCYIDRFQEVFSYNLPRAHPIAALFSESIQGFGGVVQFPKGFLKKAFEIVRSKGGLCVADEVQTGFGRTGETFWGFEAHDVVPDIVTVGKAIGNGFPLAAIITTPEVASVLGRSIHFNTFGGNPIGCVAGLEVLKVMEEENLQEKAGELGTYLMNRLADLRTEFSWVGDVRGKGLLIGLELVQDKTSLTPLPPALVSHIWESCKDMGLLFGRGALHGNVFRIKPALIIEKEDIDFSIEVLRMALKKTQDMESQIMSSQIKP